MKTSSVLLSAGILSISLFIGACAQPVANTAQVQSGGARTAATQVGRLINEFNDANSPIYKDPAKMSADFAKLMSDPRAKKLFEEQWAGVVEAVGGVSRFTAHQAIATAKGFGVRLAGNVAKKPLKKQCVIGAGGGGGGICRGGNGCATAVAFGAASFCAVASAVGRGYGYAEAECKSGEKIYAEAWAFAEANVSACANAVAFAMAFACPGVAGGYGAGFGNGSATISGVGGGGGSGGRLAVASAAVEESEGCDIAPDDGVVSADILFADPAELNASAQEPLFTPLTK